MKTLKTLALLAASLTGAFAFIDAQGPTPSPTPSPTPASTPASTPTPSLLIAPSVPTGAPSLPGPTLGPALEEPQALPPLPLMPQALPSAAPSAQPTAPATAEKPAKPKAGATPTPLPLTAEQLRKNIRLRELTTQVLREDPSVTEMRHTADLAKTFEGRRTALRDYYTLLYAKIEKLDPTLHDLIERILYARLFALEQHRVRPSTLEEPIPVLPGSHSDDHLSGRPAAGPPVAPAPTPAPALAPGENRSHLEMQ